jgi:hypothetical protein
MNMKLFNWGRIILSELDGDQTVRFRLWWCKRDAGREGVGTFAIISAVVFTAAAAASSAAAFAAAASFVVLSSTSGREM